MLIDKIKFYDEDKAHILKQITIKWKIIPNTFEYHNNCLILVIKANKRIKFIFDNSNDLNKHEKY